MSKQEKHKRKVIACLLRDKEMATELIKLYSSTNEFKLKSKKVRNRSPRAFRSVKNIADK